MEDRTRGIRLVTRGTQIPGISWKRFGADFSRLCDERKIDARKAAISMGIRTHTTERLTLGIGASCSISSVAFLAICEWMQVNPFTYFNGMNPKEETHAHHASLRDR